MASNECIPRYEGAYAAKRTVHAAAALTGKRFARLSATWQSGPGLSSTAEGGNLVANTPANGGADAEGVIGYDIASGGKGVIYSGDGTILPVTSASAISFGDKITCDAAGKAKTAATGNTVLGKAVSAVGGADLDVYIELEKSNYVLP